MLCACVGPSGDFFSSENKSTVNHVYSNHFLQTDAMQYHFQYIPCVHICVYVSQMKLLFVKMRAYPWPRSLWMSVIFIKTGDTKNRISVPCGQHERNTWIAHFFVTSFSHMMLFQRVFLFFFLKTFLLYFWIQLVNATRDLVLLSVQMILLYIVPKIAG